MEGGGVNACMVCLGILILQVASLDMILMLVNDLVFFRISGV